MDESHEHAPKVLWSTFTHYIIHIMGWVGTVSSQMDWERRPVAPLYVDVRAYCSHVKMYCKRVCLLSSHPRLFIHSFIHSFIQRGEPLGGFRQILPQKILKPWYPEMPFLDFWEDNFCLKYLLYRLSFFCLFLFAWLCVQLLDFILYFRYFFLSFQDISIGVLFLLGVL